MTRALGIVETNEDGTYVLELVGRLDTNTSSQLDVVAKRIHMADAAANIVVDLGQCGYVSSAGLRAIMTMHKRSAKNGLLTFRNVHPDVMDVFVDTGFDRILNFE